MTHYTKGTPSGRKAPPTACRRPVSETVSLPSSGCFSPFPHGTGSLSVSKEYLAFEGGPPIFRQDFTCPALLNTSYRASYTGLSPISLNFPDDSIHTQGSAGPRSLAATRGVSIDFLSSGYLDVSVPQVCSYNPMYSGNKYLFYPAIEDPEGLTITEYQVGCPIRRSRDQSLFSAPPSLSQSITSFIASYCQGIHQTPFSRLI